MCAPVVVCPLLPCHPARPAPRPQMSNLVSEKQVGLRLALRNAGMLEGAYWASWMAFDAVITLLTALLLVLFGMALQFNYFLKNDFGLLLMLFWLFGLAMTSFSYTLSVLVKKSQAAVYLGFSVFIVGWIFQSVIFVAQLPYRADTYYSETNVYGRVFFWVFSLFPWNPLTKGIVDFNEATLAPSDPGARDDCTTCCVALLRGSVRAFSIR
eukprot:GHRQ01016428.1.p1 GENE.GHRQ01016428.1~~GHRQ01016428.1.p1  ORF type:complete len:211 (+),score=89.67 GHRQ01016428.1:306-938(+)